MNQANDISTMKVTVPSQQIPRQFLDALGLFLVGKVRQRFQTGTAPDGTPWRALKRVRPNGGNKPLLDTGVLRNSFTSQVEKDGVSIGSNLPYASIHQTGGIVRPNKTKYLAIPLTKEAKRAKSPRRFRGKLIGRYGKKSGVLFTKGRNGRTIDQFLLVKEVKIPARPMLGLSDKDVQELEAMAADFALSLAPGFSADVRTF